MTTPPEPRGRTDIDVGLGVSRSPSPPPTDFVSDQWRNAAAGLWHEVRGAELWSSAAGIGNWRRTRPSPWTRPSDALENAGPMGPGDRHLP